MRSGRTLGSPNGDVSTVYALSSRGARSMVLDADGELVFNQAVYGTPDNSLFRILRK
jgi:hypothetical protein